MWTSISGSMYRFYYGYQAYQTGKLYNYVYTVTLGVHEDRFLCGFNNI
jgi:hypothetical protein